MIRACAAACVLAGFFVVSQISFDVIAVAPAIRLAQAGADERLPGGVEHRPSYPDSPAPADAAMPKPPPAAPSPETSGSAAEQPAQPSSPDSGQAATKKKSK